MTSSAPTVRAPAPRAGPAPARPAGRALRLARVAPELAMLALAGALVPARELWVAQALIVALLLVAPGLALLRALRVPGAAVVAFPVYVPCASIVVLTASGLAVNLLGPELGVDEPLRTWPLAAGLGATCLVLLAVGATAPERAGVPWRALSAPARRAWPLLLLPLAAAAGAGRLTSGEGPAVAIAAVAAAVACVVVVALLAPRMSGAHLAMVLYGAALALLLSFSLRGAFVYGFDISAEYQVLHNVYSTGSWAVAHPDDAYGAMLSLSVFPASLQALAGVSDLAILKLVFPALFALFPVAIFLLARRMLPDRWAFLAAAFIVVQGYFFQQLPGIARQEIGLLLFVALVAAVLDARPSRGSRWALVALLALALVVSHYSTTYLAIAVLALAVVLQLAVSLVRPVARLSGAMVVAVVVAGAGAALWYGPITQSSSNLGGFADSVRAQGLDLLPNREDGQGLLSAYLSGNTTTDIGAAEYARLARADVAENAPWVTPIAQADDPAYAPRDFEPAPGEGVLPRAEPALGGAVLALQQLANVLAALAALVLVVRRGTPPLLRQVAVLGLATLAVLAVIRLSGTAANAYNQERAFLQSMVPLAIALAWLVAAASRRARRAGAAVTAGAVLAVAVIGVSATGLGALVVGGGVGSNLADRGEDAERFLATPDELASARWLGSVVPEDELLYADRYAQLRVIGATGRTENLADDLVPGAIDRHAWVYAGRANAVEGRARTVFEGRFASYTFPAAFLADHWSLVYSNGTSRVYHR